MEIKGLIPLSARPGNIHLAIQQFPIASVASGSDVSGFLAVQLDVNGTGIKPADWSGDLTISPSNLVVAGNQIQSEPVQIHMDMGAAELKPVHLTAAKLLNVVAQLRGA